MSLVACGPSAGGPGGSGTDGGGAGECTSGQTQCNGNSFETCEGGHFVVSDQCSMLCNADIGCVECQPGADYCSDDAVHTCDASGHDTGMVQTCGDGLHCGGGACVDLCAQAEENRSYVGCEYWPVDLDNAVEVFPSPPDPLFGCSLAAPGAKQRSNLDVCHDASNDIAPIAGQCDMPGNTCPSGYTCEKTDVCVLDAEHSPFAVVVSNPQSFSVKVKLLTQDGMAQETTVAAGQVATLYPQQMSVPDRSVDNSGQTKRAYQILADAPIVAYQFNPLDNTNVFSNDGSLLVPRHAFDAKYYAMTWPTLTRRNLTPSTNDYNGYVTVVSWKDGTQIQVTPSARVRGGVGNFQAIPKGESKTFTLDAFDVLNLEAVGDGDLTGTLIESVDGQSTFGVYAGHEATLIPSKDGDCCADHLEEMMFPTSTWGTDYAVARSKDRGMNEADVLRVVAQEDGTTVTFDPAPSKGSCPTLAAGEFCTVDIMNDTAVSADKPILVGHFLKSVEESDILGNVKGTGDPGMALSVPTAQFRPSYTFLVPQDYDQQYVSVVAKPGMAVGLDGTDVTGQFTSFAGGAWAGARIQVTPGQHTLSCQDGCGLEVYGYSDAVSYLFAGGLDLKQIVVDRH